MCAPDNRATVTIRLAPDTDSAPGHRARQTWSTLPGMRAWASIAAAVVLFKWLFLIDRQVFGRYWSQSCFYLVLVRAVLYQFLG